MKRVTIVGLGLMGTSLAGAIRSSGHYEVTGVDSDSRAVENAMEKGYIDRGLTTFEKMPAPDIIFLCVYPEGILDFIRKHKEKIGSHTVVTDISGIQGELCRKIEEEASDLRRIGGHPLCGSEGRGFEKAEPGFFKGAPYVLIDSGKTEKQAMELVKEVLKAAGVGEISIMTPEAHDRHVAVVSHLPHLISSAFLTAFEHGDFELHGGSFDDLVRIADINSDLWTQIVKNNKMNVMEVLEDFLENLHGLKALVEMDDFGGVRRFFERTGEIKRSFGSGEKL